MTFLDDVLEAKWLEIKALRARPAQAGTAGAGGGFEQALRGPALSVIAEIKRRSPSKGPLATGLDAGLTALAYRDGGAAAISCLTDRTFFGARLDDLKDARHAGLPVLRKDFLIDRVQIDESRAMGADAVLLIVRILGPAELKQLLDHARSRGLDALVEVHDEAEVDRALAAGASLIGVNNRDLETLVVDPKRALHLRPRIPKGVLSVAESGVSTRDDVRRIADAGFDAVLIGEALAASAVPAVRLRELLGEAPEAIR